MSATTPGTEQGSTTTVSAAGAGGVRVLAGGAKDERVGNAEVKNGNGDSHQEEQEIKEKAGGGMENGV